MKRSFLTISTCIAALALASGGCDGSSEPDKRARAKLETPAITNRNSPTFGPGTTIAAGISPWAIAIHRTGAHIVGMGSLAAVHVDTLDSFARVNTLGPAWDVALAGDDLFVADGRSGLTKYTIDARGLPQFAEHVALSGNCKRVIMLESRVAVLCSPRTLLILRSGQRPQSIRLPGDPIDATYSNASIWLACPGDGLVRIDEDIRRPVATFNHEKLDRILSVTSVGKRIFVGLRDKRVLELEPETGKVLGESSVLSRPMRLFAGENHLLIASTWLGDTGATWVDISEPGHPRISGRLPFSVATAAHLGANRWIVGRPDGSLSELADDGQVLAHKNGVRFERLGWSSSWRTSWADEREASWNWAPQANEMSFASRKIADATPCGAALCTLEAAGRVCRWQTADQEPDCLDLSREATALSWQSSRQALWVIDANGGLHRLLLNPNLHEVQTVPRAATTAPQNLGRLTIDGDRGVAVDVDFGILQIVDLGDTPRFRGRFLLQAPPKAVALVKDVAFVAEPQGGLQVISIDEPDVPRELAWKPMVQGASGVAARPDAAGRLVVVVAEGERGISVWRWNDELRQLTEVRHSDTHGLASEVVILEDDVFVADGSSILRFSWPELAP